ncbi:MAG: hypothetical protein PVG56_11240 [Anaerolineae bacterium]|jgi:hypothetical protein
MLSADYRAARAVMEARLAEAQDQAGEVGQGYPAAVARQTGPAQRLLRRLALLLVAVGGRLVRAGLPPYRPTAAEVARRG